MTEFHINSDKEPPPETVNLLAKAAQQIEQGRRDRPYRWWRFWHNLREHPPDATEVVGLAIGIAILVWGIWSGEIRLW